MNRFLTLFLLLPLSLGSVPAHAAEATPSDVYAQAIRIDHENMSHELRTPMTAIMGMSDLALRRATDPKQIDLLNKSKNSASKLLGIINDILNISKIEAERLTIESVPFKLDDVLKTSPTC